jgi:isopropylmalate/homocitrate/citramalate synthase
VRFRGFQTLLEVWKRLTHLLCCCCSEHNAVEDANLDLAKETLETHKAMLNIHEDIAAVAEAHKEAVALMCEVQAYKLRHKTRETFVKNLESIRDIESSYNLELQKSMVANATSKVRAVVQKGDKKLKEDDVAALFTKELRAYASDLEAKQGQVVKLTAAEQTELQADLDAYMKRFGLDDAGFKAPKEVKLELM